MRIRFRAINPIPSFRCGQAAKTNHYRLIIMRIRFRASNFVRPQKQITFEQNRNRLLVRGCARVIRFFARVTQQLRFWTQKIQADVDYCYVRRRAECTSLVPGLEHPSLRSDSSLATRRLTGALHVVLSYFFQQSIRAQHESCCSVCTLA